MKALLRALGAILAICGLVIYFIAGSAQEEMEPNEVKVGYVSNGNFVETDSGQIGGNEEGQKSMESVKAFGTFAGTSKNSLSTKCPIFCPNFCL